MLKPGQIVKSIAGHDKGSFYMIVESEAGHVKIADGKARKLIKPKRKNPLHVKPTNKFFDVSVIVTDKKLRKALAEYRGEISGEGECDFGQVRCN
ncbi:MAG: KOW domain-containing RNA-binding protein [Oscillospiraceae bacterium]|nr:KOW domain-containing RNA-binding protein [Oscillospiraceae bacterium]